MTTEKTKSKINKVKLVWALDSTYDDGYDDEISRRVLIDSITDWTEISDEELLFLRQNLYKLSLSQNMSHLRPIIIVDDGKNLLNVITDLKDYIRKEREKLRKQEEARQERVRKAKEERKRRLEEAAAKKALQQGKAESLSVEEEMKLLQKLKNKYES